MKHYGDITKINGADVEPVDIIVGGSPCQDLSLAGGRKGLSGERSGLFIEQLRIVKEMRDADRKMGRTDRYIRPRFMVWENVPGAFSSNGGRDFQTVLTEIVRIVRPDAPNVPLFGGDKRWSKSGTLLGFGEDGCPFSLSYRLHDAQFWGVPQRRKRISLVVDFGGVSAPEILFERESGFGDTPKSESEKQSLTESIGRSFDETSRAMSFRERAGCEGGGKGILIQDERTGSLSSMSQSVLRYTEL